VISDNAKGSIDGIFRKAAQSRLVLAAGDTCEIAAIPTNDAGLIPEAQVVVLTISSILFRLMLMLQFDEGADTRDYFFAEGSASTVQEIFSEQANLCCGAMNQELLRYFPDLGMSTPYVLNAHCIAHLEDLKPAYLASYAVTVNQAARIKATVCVCTHAPLDFVADLSALEESCGELELF